MKNIGGEIEFKNNLFESVTDSGRSSLKLVLKSLPNKNIKFILPDFLCGVIPDVFDEEGVSYSFYKINEDLSIDWNSVEKAKYDAFYAINYFGQKHDFSKLSPDKLLIEDFAFLADFSNPKRSGEWAGFNSFRKISCAPDGSVVKSTFALDENIKSDNAAPFSTLKFDAKKIKSEYITGAGSSEKDYLDLFEKGEEALDAQTEIYSISSHGILRVFDFLENLEQEKQIRSKNYITLDKSLSAMSIPLNPEFHSFYILKVDKRDGLRRHLFSQKIYLPVHWPKPAQCNNSLYEKIISIPVDSRYDEKDMARIADAVNNFYKP